MGRQIALRVRKYPVVVAGSADAAPADTEHDAAERAELLSLFAQHGQFQGHRGHREHI
jgi:hypothetical protein